MNVTMPGFTYILQRLGSIVTEVKLNEGLLNGPHIRIVVQHDDFEDHLNAQEKRAWRSFKEACKNILSVYQLITRSL